MDEKLSLLNFFFSFCSFSVLIFRVLFVCLLPVFLRERERGEKWGELEVVWVEKWGRVWEERGKENNVKI